MPDRFAIAAPIQAEGPARQGFAGIPFALAVMQKAARRESGLQAADQRIGKHAFGRADGVGVPLARLEIINRHEGRLAAHGQPHIACGKGGIDLVAQRVQIGPSRIGKRLGDAGVFGGARHRHVKIKADLGIAGQPGNRRGVGIMRRGGQRDMAFAGQQARGRVQPDPACAGQIHLAPRMQIGEILRGACGAVDGHQIGFQLNEVARDKPRRKAQMPQRLHQQPGCIAARTFANRQGFFGRLHPRLHADDIADFLRELRVQPDDEIGGAQRCAGDAGQQGLQQRAGGIGLAVDHQIVGNIGGVIERPGFGAGFDEEIERVVDGHVGGEIDLDTQFCHRIGKDIARQPVAVGVLLIVHEMIGGRDLQRVRHDPRAAVRRGAQPDHLRAKRDRAVVFVMGQVVDAGKNGHVRCFQDWRVLSHRPARSATALADLPGFHRLGAGISRSSPN
ncbi:MAG: hypothetical protein ACD_54C00976G0001 [uncultured bacterium]|nr:MAG: hypothetical protein ACD_54C00976G0001 [uncultured bacterium]